MAQNEQMYAFEIPMEPGANGRVTTSEIKQVAEAAEEIGDEALAEARATAALAQQEVQAAQLSLDQATATLTNATQTRDAAQKALDTLNIQLTNLGSNAGDAQKILTDAKNSLDSANKALSDAVIEEAIARNNVDSVAQLAVAANENHAAALKMRDAFAETVKLSQDSIDAARGTIPQLPGSIDLTVTGGGRVDASSFEALQRNYATLRRDWKNAVTLDKANYDKLKDATGSGFVRGTIRDDGAAIFVRNPRKATLNGQSDFLFDVYRAGEPDELIGTFNKVDLTTQFDLGTTLDNFVALTDDTVARFITNAEAQQQLLSRQLDATLNVLAREKVGKTGDALRLIENQENLFRGLRGQVDAEFTRFITAVRERKGFFGADPLGNIYRQSATAQENLVESMTRITSADPAAVAKVQSLETRLGEQQKALDELRLRASELERKARDLEQTSIRTRDDLQIASEAKDKLDTAAKQSLTSLEAAQRDADTALKSVDDLAKQSPELAQKLGVAQGELKVASDQAADAQKYVEEARKASEEALKDLDIEKVLTNEGLEQIAPGSTLTPPTTPVSAPTPNAPPAEVAKGSKWKGVAKEFGKGIICGGIGNLAGFFAYRSDLSEEVENKISLNAGSGNVLDPTTSNLIFQKGQTYKFIVGPGAGSGKSNTVSIDIVDPTTLVPATAWLDDCGQK